MSSIQGMGPCGIPKADNYPCGKQIQEGESIGTVTTPGGPVTGHKKCADMFYMRKQASERQEREAMVKKYNQQGPGGAMDTANPQDLVMGSIPLDKPEVPANFTPPPGVNFIGDLPMDASPDDAVNRARGVVADQPNPLIEQMRAEGQHPADVAPAPGYYTDHFYNDEERAELEEVHQRLLARRRERQAQEAPVTHTINVDMSQVPQGAHAISIVLDLRKLRRD